MYQSLWSLIKKPVQFTKLSQLVPVFDNLFNRNYFPHYGLSVSFSYKFCMHFVITLNKFQFILIDPFFKSTEYHKGQINYRYFCPLNPTEKSPHTEPSIICLIKIPFWHFLNNCSGSKVSQTCLMAKEILYWKLFLSLPILSSFFYCIAFIPTPDFGVFVSPSISYYGIISGVENDFVILVWVINPDQLNKILNACLICMSLNVLNVCQ